MDLPMSAALSSTPAQQLNERFTRLYTQFQPRITRLVQHEVRDGNHALAEDLTADAFFRAWLDLHKCRATTDAQMYGWLAAVARRTVMAHYRTKKNTAETPVDTGTWQYSNREMGATAAGYYTPAATGFRTATWSDDDNKPVIPRIPGPRKTTASNGDVCPLCEYFRCRCKTAQAHHPGDSDPDPDEALRRIQGRPAPIRQGGGTR